MSGHKKGELANQPEVTIKVGKEVKLLDNQPKVIFVFGGPGTKKGKILDDLANVFGMEIINVENILLDNLSKNVENIDPLNFIPMIQNLLKTEEHLIKLDTVLRNVGRAIKDVDISKFCVVDIMPNLKWMLSNPLFIKECSSEFKAFEEKFPVSFVMNFVIPKDYLLTRLEHAKTNRDDDKKKADVPKQSDEADSGRTEKRVMLYESSVKYFMEYFHKTNRVVTVDVSCGRPELIWGKVCEFLARFDLQSKRIPECITVFGFGEKDLDLINVENYNLMIIKLKEIVQDPTASVEVLLDEVCRYTKECHPNKRVFAIDGTDTTLTKDLKKMKSGKLIQFVENGDDCKLGRYCSLNLSKKSAPVELQAVSTLQNEVCLFSKDINPDLCKWIAFTMAECRNQQAG